MKNTLLTTLIFLATVGANATSLHPDTYAKRAQLTNIKMDPSYAQPVKSAEVLVNHVTKTVKLVLKHPSICGPARPGYATCLAFAPDTVVEAKITEVKRDGCGSTLIVARENRMPVDGSLVEIKVLDHSQMVCEIYLPANRVTEVNFQESWYGRMQGGVRTQRSYLSGSILR